jgi:uncharacterized protein YqfB (UPF0267 family)
MSDVVLADGREITIDLSKVTWGEHVGVFDSSESDEKSDRTVAKACGLDYKKEFCKLDVISVKRIYVAYFKKNAEPLADLPNSLSAST